MWTFTALCADTKLMVTWLVGVRNVENTHTFIHDLAGRFVGRIQLTTDGNLSYKTAVEAAWGWNGVDFAQLIKTYGADPESGNARRYSPPVCLGIEKRRIMGDPDMAKVSTSYVENSNLGLRMRNRRFTRLTNGFSRKVENHAHAVALHFMAHNFCRPHGTLTKKAGGSTLLRQWQQDSRTGFGRLKTYSPLWTGVSGRPIQRITDSRKKREVWVFIFCSGGNLKIPAKFERSAMPLIRPD